MAYIRKNALDACRNWRERRCAVCDESVSPQNEAQEILHWCACDYFATNSFGYMDFGKIVADSDAHIKVEKIV